MNVKLFWLFIFFATLSPYSKAQLSTNKPITDSTIIHGIVKEDVYVGESVNSNCYVDEDVKLSKGTVVYVVGAKSCYNNYVEDYSCFYEIINNAKTYFISESKLSIVGDYTFNEINLLPEQVESKFREHTTFIAKGVYTIQLSKSLTSLNKYKFAGLAIYDWDYYDESEYTEGTSINISVYNPTKKTIKYIWFKFIGYNAVGDKVLDIKSRSYLATKKAIGPIKPDVISKYAFEYVWFSDLVENVKIVSIKVQYMDGTVKVINKPNSIVISKNDRELLDSAMNE